MGVIDTDVPIRLAFADVIKTARGFCRIAGVEAVDPAAAAHVEFLVQQQGPRVGGFGGWLRQNLHRPRRLWCRHGSAGAAVSTQAELAQHHVPQVDSGTAHRGQVGDAFGPDAQPLAGAHGDLIHRDAGTDRPRGRHAGIKRDRLRDRARARRTRRRGPAVRHPRILLRGHERDLGTRFSRLRGLRPSRRLMAGAKAL